MMGARLGNCILKKGPIQKSTPGNLIHNIENEAIKKNSRYYELIDSNEEVYIILTFLFYFCFQRFLWNTKVKCKVLHIIGGYLWSNK